MPSTGGSRDHAPSRPAVILHDDDDSDEGARTRFDPRGWLRDLADHPADVAHQIELARLHGDEAIEALLGGVEIGSRYPVRASSSPLHWMLPKVFRRPRPVSVLDKRFSAHVAAVLGLAAHGDGPGARRIRSGLRELHLPQRTPWWLTDSLESFTAITHFTVPGTPWHPAASFPRRLLCLPTMNELNLHGAGLGDHRLGTTEWNLPAVQRLSLAGNALTAVPDQVLTLGALEVLYLCDNPGLQEVPAALADRLPRLRYCDLRRTGVTVVPPRLRDRPGLYIQLGG